MDVWCHKHRRHKHRLTIKPKAIESGRLPINKTTTLGAQASLPAFSRATLCRQGCMRFQVPVTASSMSLKQENSLRDWIALSFIIGVGSRTAALLIDRFGSPSAVFESSDHSLESAGL